jgi:hypothetical protein
MAASLVLPKLWAAAAQAVLLSPAMQPNCPAALMMRSESLLQLQLLALQFLFCTEELFCKQLQQPCCKA